MTDTTATDRFDASIARIRRADSARAGYARDTAENRLDAIKAASAEAMDAIRATLNTLAEKAGASEADRRHAIDAAADVVSDLCWSEVSAIEGEIAEMDAEIERADRPDAPIIL